MEQPTSLESAEPKQEAASEQSPNTSFNKRIQEFTRKDETHEPKPIDEGVKEYDKDQMKETEEALFKEAAKLIGTVWTHSTVDYLLADYVVEELETYTSRSWNTTVLRQ
jgi:hypothetical protein